MRPFEKEIALKHWRDLNRFSMKWTLLEEKNSKLTENQMFGMELNLSLARDKRERA